MSTWSGWQTDLLSAAALPTSSDNHAFLSDWGGMEETGCTNNPVVISHQARGSSDCKKLTSARTAQNYTNQAQAASAFTLQLHSGTYPHLLAALRSGHPFNVSDQHDVIGDLIAWGALAYADALLNNYGPLQPKGGPQPAHGVAPHALKGWSAIRKSGNRTLPAALHASERSVNAAYRSLRRARKVRA